MTFRELRKQEGYITGLVALERIMPRKARAMTKKFLILVAPLFMIIVLFFQYQYFVTANFLYGLMIIVCGVWLFICMLDSFYYAHYFLGVHFSVPEWGVGPNNGIPFEILEIVAGTHGGDLTGGFLTSRSGKDILKHLGLSDDVIKDFVASNRTKIYADPMIVGDPISLNSYAAAVYYTDKSFAAFLSKHNITGDNLVVSAAWLASVNRQKKETFRWWGRDALGHIRNLVCK